MPSQGSTNQRGYGWKHQALRAKWKRRQKSGLILRCWRCGRPILGDQQWDLGHDDNDRTITIGPEHALKKDCPAGGNRAAPRRNAKPKALGFFD